MEPTALVALVASAFSIVGAVVTMWFARRASSGDAQRRVDELAATVEAFARVARRDQMRRVRAASSDHPVADPPPELRAAPEAPALTKDELRRRMFPSLIKRG